ncbi:23S rRNA (guanosine(2251)-2'-O)-methyltransferase RlmB [Membranihabitans marinus]|uniref:23S rRNA (guanosine(2251)-2'-O)-methyltransferase RlmB n=1 Tax=Membranihabitans marinus TaxID=1227546 RepID=UPI001F00A8A0|nr:23S rRNA (guanosine(2251)-2'-O)-methyltransferase RlmB [Membranihabitans marinus]
MKEKTDLIVGRKPILDAMAADLPIASIWIDTGLKGGVEIEIRNAAQERAIPIKRVHKTVLNKKSQANHQGIIAYTSPVRFQSLDMVIAQVYELGEVPFFIYLDRVQDVGNLGSIVRSAETLGVHGLILPTKKMAPINDQVAKISCGALHHISISRVATVQEAINTLQNNGIQIISSSLEAKQPLSNIDLKSPICIVIGSEDNGVSPVFISQSDQLYIIPQLGQTESLNAAVAAGISMYEVQRQRKYADLPSL